MNRGRGKARIAADVVWAIAAARQALADPNDAGGAVGRTVVEGSLSRPDSPVSSTEPGIQRAEAIRETPGSSGWRADGLASGSVRECGADLDDAAFFGVRDEVGHDEGALFEDVR